MAFLSAGHVRGQTNDPSRLCSTSCMAVPARARISAPAGNFRNGPELLERPETSGTTRDVAVPAPSTRIDPDCADVRPGADIHPCGGIGPRADIHPCGGLRLCAGSGSRAGIGPSQVPALAPAPTLGRINLQRPRLRPRARAPASVLTQAPARDVRRPSALQRKTAHLELVGNGLPRCAQSQ